jgi:UDP-N-acetyl-D-glucosamine dehydrogenase
MNKQIISVIGLGYVGIPIVVAAAKAGYKVIGIDTDLDKITKIKSGISPTEDISGSEITELINKEFLEVTSDYSKISFSKIIVICVPTPLSDNSIPDLTFLGHALNSVGENLNEETLVIIESTIAPGTTRNYVVPILVRKSGLDPNQFGVVFSPERIDPNNKLWNLKNVPKILAGLRPESAKQAVDFYSKFIDEVIDCKSIEVAETAKLLENSFRFINISFINEINIFCQKLGIDVNQVISAAATKPYGFMPFYPGIGVGGHCIPVDPLYLANKAREIGAPIRFIDLAYQINQEMPGYFVGRAEEKLGSLKAKKVLVVGVSYKPNVADVRESPVEGLIAGLRLKNAHVSWHDDLVKEWNGEKSVALSNQYDLAILATPHAYLDLTKLGDVPILNTRGSI